MDQPKVQLSNLIQRSTSQMLSEPSVELYQQISKLINSRADIRLIIKNPKVLILTFDLLQYLSYACQLPILQQISTKDFLMRVGGIIRAKISQDVLHRLSLLIKVWEGLMRQNKDLLDMFWKFYSSLQQRSEISIPSSYNSKYSQIGSRKKKSSYVSRAQRQHAQKKKYQQQIGKPKHSQNTNKSENLTLLSQSILVINQIIDSCDHRERVGENQMLNQLMRDLTKNDNKLVQSLLAPDSHSQQFLKRAFQIKEDIQITMRRYSALQKNKRPQPFIKTQSQSPSQRNPYSSYSNQTFVPKQAKKLPDTVFSNFDTYIPIKKPQPQKPIIKQKSPVDIIDLLEDLPVISQTKQTKQTSQVKQKNNILEMYPKTTQKADPMDIFNAIPTRGPNIPSQVQPVIQPSIRQPMMGQPGMGQPSMMKSQSNLEYTGVHPSMPYSMGPSMGSSMGPSMGQSPMGVPSGMGLLGPHSMTGQLMMGTMAGQPMMAQQPRSSTDSTRQPNMNLMGQSSSVAAQNKVNFEFGSPKRQQQPVKPQGQAYKGFDQKQASLVNLQLL